MADAAGASGTEGARLEGGDGRGHPSLRTLVLSWT
jgi:hypothetical protein